MPDFHGNPPAERVQAFLDRTAEVNAQYPKGHYNHYVDELDEFGTGEVLSLSDMRDVLTQLDEALDFIGQIDAVLDEQGGDAYVDLVDTLSRIRTLLGNHTDKKGLTNG